MKTASRQLMAAGAAFVGLSVAFVVALDSRSADTIADTEAREQLVQLAQLDAALDSELLQARFGVAASYDDVVRARRAFADMLRTVRRGHVEDLSLSDASLKAALEALEKEWLRKEAHLEKVKRLRAHVENSRRYLPEAIDLARAVDPRKADDVETALLRLELSPDKDVRTHLESEADRLNEKNNVRELRSLGKHLQETLNLRLNQSVDAYLSSSLGAHIAKVSQEYHRCQAELQQRARIANYWLGGCTLLLLGFVSYVTRRLMKMNVAEQRFVPKQFLDLIGKGSLADVQSGDAKRLEMSVLFADIRDFTSTSEQRSPEDNFKFMNEYHEAMEKPIHDHHGFVNQYLGDGIMALFDREPHDAIDAAIGMFIALDKFNDGKEKPTSIGVGVNTGKVMLGAIGGKDRSNAGVISDAVNLAARVEGLTKRYGVKLLVSEHTVSQIPGAREKYVLRLVDRVAVKGKQSSISLYEVCDVDEPKVKLKKKELMKRYEDALNLYFTKEFLAAAEAFEALKKELPDDKLIELHWERCRKLYWEGAPQGFDGVSRLEEK